MDKRNTIVTPANLIEILKELQETQQIASLLIDEDGLTRAEGLVKEIDANTEPVMIYLDNGKVIPLKNLVAVNGNFLSDYSEC